MRTVVTLDYETDDEVQWEIEASVAWGRRATREDPSEPTEVEFVSVTRNDGGDEPLVLDWNDFVVKYGIDAAIVDALEETAIDQAADLDALDEE